MTFSLKAAAALALTLGAAPLAFAGIPGPSQFVRVGYVYYAAPTKADTYLVVGTDKGELNIHAVTGTAAHERIIDSCYKVASYSLEKKVPVLIYAPTDVSPGSGTPGPFPTLGSVQAYSVTCSIVDTSVQVPQLSGHPE